MKKMIMCFFLYILSVQYSFAIIDGDQLLHDCNNYIQVVNNNGFATNPYIMGTQLSTSGECDGFVAAVADNLIEKDHKCFPINSTYEDYTRITAKFLQTHPSMLSYPANFIVEVALIKAYKCYHTKN